MATTNFINGTVIQPAWLNPVDSAAYAYLTAVVGTNTITATGPASYVAYAQQSGFILMPQNTNTGAVTLNISGLGAKAITKYGNNPLVAGDLVVGALAYVMYDGTQFQLLNPQVVDIAHGGTGATTASQALVNLGAVGRLLGVQVFTANGTYTPTTGTTRIIVELCGGGGAGGGTSATGAGQVACGGGGGAAGYVRSLITSGFSGQSVVIGAAGVGVSAGTGGTGGNSTFMTLSATGGAGGGNSGAGATPIVGGGNGGNATGGNIINLPGTAGSEAGAASTAIGFSGCGGPTPLGEPGLQIVVSGSAGVNNGRLALGYGAGGGGARAGASQAAGTGGNGAPGICIIYEYS